MEVRVKEVFTCEFSVATYRFDEEGNLVEVFPEESYKVLEQGQVPCTDIDALSDCIINGEFTTRDVVLAIWKKDQLGDTFSNIRRELGYAIVDKVTKSKAMEEPEPTPSPALVPVRTPEDLLAEEMRIVAERLEYRRESENMSAVMDLAIPREREDDYYNMYRPERYSSVSDMGLIYRTLPDYLFNQ